MFSSREGVTLDSVAAPIRKWILSPSNAIPVAAALSLGSILKRSSPELLAALAAHPIFSHIIHLSSPKSALQKPACIIAAISVALATNGWLTRNVRNNWVDDQTWDFDKEIVLITGGSSGIGASVAQRLITKNRLTRIVIVDIVPPSWVVPAGANVHYYECDLKDPDAIRDLGDRVRNDIGHPTVLFNNAGVARLDGILEAEDTEFIVQTNLTAQMLMTKEFLPEMVVRDHGHIVYSASMSGIVPAPFIASYSATKAGLIAFHDAMQSELRLAYNAPKVRQTLGIFTFIQTPMVAGNTSSSGSSNFFIPLLNVETVSEALVDGVYSGYGSTIYLPGISRIVAALQGAPEWLFRTILLAAGAAIKGSVEKMANSEDTHQNPAAKRYLNGEKERAILRQQRLEAEAVAKAIAKVEADAKEEAKPAAEWLRIAELSSESHTPILLEE